MKIRASQKGHLILEPSILLGATVCQFQGGYLVVEPPIWIKKVVTLDDFPRYWWRFKNCFSMWKVLFFTPDFRLILSLPRRYASAIKTFVCCLQWAQENAANRKRSEIRGTSFLQGNFWKHACWRRYREISGNMSVKEKIFEYYYYYWRLFLAVSCMFTNPPPHVYFFHFG